MPVPALTLLWMPIVIPLAAGLLALLIGRLRNEFSFIGIVATIYYALRIFLSARHGVLTYDYMTIGPVNIGLRVDSLSAFCLIATAFLGLIVIIFSYRYMRGQPGSGAYYLFILFTVGCANGVFMASNLIVVLFFWGFLAAILYGMLFLSTKEASGVAMKGLVIAAGADLAMTFGIGLLLFGVGSSDIAPELRVPLNGVLPILSFSLIAIGALAKAGSMPFHTWIPDAAGTAPATFMGFVPGAVDKLLGIYLLTRVSTYVFDISSSMAIRNILMGVGSLTILAAVVMALVQKDALRLLSFHAVSQVGYMVLGIGTGNAVGIAGGLFHMINHAIYKSTLFYTAGAIEHRTQETRLDRLGGLGPRMPVTLVSFFIASLAISGVPPLNGFASKWMVYQGVLQLGQEGNKLWPLFLVAAMLGSVFTLASFLKVLHSLFFGQPAAGMEKVKEVGLSMWLPPLLQAAVCVLFGVFANLIPVRWFVLPSVPRAVLEQSWQLPGFWQPATATGLMLLGLALGLVIYLLGTAVRVRPSEAFSGGEEMTTDESRIPGTEFYGPVKALGSLSRLFAAAEAGATDFYNLGIGAAQGAARFVFIYVDRVVDGFYRVASDIIITLGRGMRTFGVWFFLLLLVPVLVFAGTGRLEGLQYFAIALMIGGGLMALVEPDFARYMMLLSLTQLGFVILAFSQGEMIGRLAGLFQIYNSGIAYLCVYLAYRLVMRSGGPATGTRLINDFRGVSESMPVATLGFIIGGLSLAGMPPSGNFFSKYLLAAIYPNNEPYTIIIIFVAMLMLGVILRVVSQVFFGPPNAQYREERGRLYYASLVVSILAMFNGVLAKPLIDLLSLVFRVAVQ
jgi:formate hydrogenlyase subunit 3/multisubunit Na+/H+ antiporter MnhD subunit